MGTRTRVRRDTKKKKSTEDKRENKPLFWNMGNAWERGKASITLWVSVFMARNGRFKTTIILKNPFKE